MQVRRIVPNLATDDVERATAFYRDLLGLTVVMDHGWIATFAAPDAMAAPQLSVASEGGSGMPVPDISIEVDDLDEAMAQSVGLPGAPPFALRLVPRGLITGSWTPRLGGSQSRCECTVS